MVRKRKTYDKGAKKENGFDLDFGMEIHLTSAYDTNRIKSFYPITESFAKEKFKKMENLVDTDLRRFVLYRNIVACFANGLESSLTEDLLRNTKPLIFAVKKKSQNVWSLQASSAFLGTKYFAILIDCEKTKLETKRFNLEFDEQTLSKAFKTRDGSFAMISEDNKIFKKKIIKFDKASIEINWQDNEVKITPTNPSRLDLLDQLSVFRSKNQKVSCLYPRCSFYGSKLKMIPHYITHDNANAEFFKNKLLIKKTLGRFARNRNNNISNI